MWWRSAVPRHLPLTQGPYVPGCFDLMSGFTEESTFVRFYYPSSIAKEENNHTKWYNWLPHEKYVEGFAFVANKWPSLLKLLLWTYGGEPQVPGVWEAPVTSGERKLPLIVYSHGFGATRFISATIGAELASYGFVFASIEHKDTSACTTYYYESQEKLDSNEPTWIPHVKIHFGPNHYPIRNKQLHRRMAEFRKLIDLVEDINNGTAVNILPSNFDLSSLKGRLDTSSICAMGHSFGGATCILTMGHDKRLTSGVIHDGWMFPLKEEQLVVEQPMIFINSQTFHIPANLEVIDKYLSEPKGSSHEVFTIRHTSHDVQTDMPHIIGSSWFMNWFARKLDCVIGTNLNNHLTLRFLKQHTGFPSEADESEKYLEEQKDNFVAGTILESMVARRG